LTFLSGDSLVISENQLFDSLGFIEAFNEIKKSFGKNEANINLPIKVAIRDKSKNIYDIVGDHFLNPNFKLSLWDELDLTRRLDWGKKIKERKINDLIGINNSENELIKQLWIVLDYFKPQNCISADNIPDEFQNRILKIIKLSDSDIEGLYTGYQDGIYKRRFFNDHTSTEAAKEIRDSLKRIFDINNELRSRSIVRKQLELLENVSLQDGIVELTDGIYNQTLGIASSAMLIQSSFFPTRDNEYVIAGYNLSTYLQDTSNSLSRYINWEIFCFDNYKNIESLEYPDKQEKFIQLLESARKEIPWNKLFALRNNENWKNTLLEFQLTLESLQNIVKNLSEGSLSHSVRERLENDRNKLQKDLSIKWDRHMNFSAKNLTNDYWTITPNSIQIKNPNDIFSIDIVFNHLNIKLDIEDSRNYQLWRSIPKYKSRIDERI
jgi:hypothetical protein